jgi:hypothetical protein
MDSLDARLHLRPLQVGADDHPWCIPHDLRRGQHVIGDQVLDDRVADTELARRRLERHPRAVVPVALEGRRALPACCHRVRRSLPRARSRAAAARARPEPLSDAVGDERGVVGDARARPATGRRAHTPLAHRRQQAPEPRARVGPRAAHAQIIVDGDDTRKAQVTRAIGERVPATRWLRQSLARLIQGSQPEAESENMEPEGQFRAPGTGGSEAAPTPVFGSASGCVVAVEGPLRTASPCGRPRRVATSTALENTVRVPGRPAARLDGASRTQMTVQQGS